MRGERVVYLPFDLRAYDKNTKYQNKINSLMKLYSGDCRARSSHKGRHPFSSVHTFITFV